MSHPIDHVFCNPVENSFCGHPHTPRKFLPSSPPIPSGFPLTILVGGGGGGGGGGWGGYGLFSRITQCLSTGSQPFSSLSSRFLHPFPKQRACYPTCYPWGLRKNYGHSVLVEHNITPAWFTYQEMVNFFRTKSNQTEFDCVRFCSIGSIIELTAKYTFDYGRLPNPIERLVFDWIRLNFGSIFEVVGDWQPCT